MRYTEEEKLSYVQAWQETKLSRKQFSISSSLSYASFLSWTKKYTEQEEDLGFIKLEDKGFGSTKIVLPNGVMIQTEQVLSMSLVKALSNV